MSFRRRGPSRTLARFLSAAVALAALAAGAPASGQGSPGGKPPAPPAAQPVELKLPVTRFSLDNGLRVVLHEDHTSPVVAIAVVYNAGAREEERGRGGLAHLFERLMFQGSKNVKKGEHTSLVASRGGSAGAATTADHASYFEVLPSHELALGLWLEADRMRSLDITEESFQSQREALREERRAAALGALPARSDWQSSPRGALRLGELVFEGTWPYGHPIFGAAADLDGARLDWIEDFQAKHHGPNNATLAVAGDIDPSEATRLVHRYFDSIPRIQAAPFTDAAVPEQTSERTAVLRDEHARSPSVLCGWRAPPMREPGAYALDLLAIVLGGGQSSRLHQLLVRDRAVALEASARLAARRGPSMFEIDAKLAPGAKLDDVRRLVEGVLKDVADRGPTAGEVARAQRQAQARLVLGLQTALARARSFAEYELFFGDAGLLAGEAARYLAVTADDMKKAAAAHLTVTKRTVIEVYPPEEPKEEKKAPAAPKTAADPKKAPPAKPAADPKKAPPAKPAAGGKKGASKGPGKKKGAP